MIKKRGEKYVLYTSNGKRQIAKHDTKSGAQRQERAIQWAKHHPYDRKKGR